MLWVFLPWTLFSRRLYETQLLKFGLINLVQKLILNAILQFESFQRILSLLHYSCLLRYIISIQFNCMLSITVSTSLNETKLYPC